MARKRRFTIYDAMDERGDFEKNPANVGAKDSQGFDIYKKAEFPKMVYHPEGLMRITRPADIIATPLGPKAVGEQKELISKIVNDEESLAAALAEGWHNTPAKALAAAKGEPLPETPEEKIARLEKELALMSLQRNVEADKILAEARAAGAVVKAKPSSDKSA